MSPIETCTLRILNYSGKTVGTGFLVAPDLAVTCAHVAARAEAAEGEKLQVQPSQGSERIPALVMPGYWRDVDKGDVAFLKLDYPPPGMTVPRLGFAKDSAKGSPFNSFGYGSAAGIQGLFANGSIDGYLGEHQLIQLQSPQADHGSSGAPVFDEKRGLVVGMINMGHTGAGKNENTVFATCCERLFEIYADLFPSETVPYIGLKTFDSANAQFFCGRKPLVDKLLDALRGDCRFLAVLGASGSGKSSLIRAGLLPALQQNRLPDSSKWMQITIRPGNNPFEPLKNAGLEPLDAAQFLLAHPDKERVLLFIDQFEELFTTCPKDLRERFVHELAMALKNAHMMLVIAMRNEFYSEFTDKAEELVNSGSRKMEDVPARLTQDELRAMIEEPARAVGLAFEEGLAQRILDDVVEEAGARSSCLPLLEFTLTKLWENRQDGRMTHAVYENLGGVAGSLAKWAGEAFSELSPEEQAASISLLTTMVHLGDKAQDLPDTRRRCSRSEIAYSDTARHVIDHFTDRHLLITNGETIELVHDTLVREWHGLQDWIDADRENLRMREGLGEAARQWQANGLDEGLLTHRGTRLKQAQEINSNPKYYLTENEKSYLAACVQDEELEKERIRRLAEAEEREKLTNQQLAESKEREEQKGKSSKRLFIALTGVLVLLVASALGYFLTRERPVPGKWIRIPAGDFLMGMDEEERKLAYDLCTAGSFNKDECILADDLQAESGRQMDATLDEYAILENEVTNAQYQQCLDAGECQAPQDWQYEKTTFNQPASRLDWFEATAYCTWLGGRLPTEGEWEKAARGPGNNSYPWGNEWEKGKANLERAGVGNVGNVIQFAQGDISGYGVINLAGNVKEWTASVALPVDVDQKFSNEPYQPTGLRADLPPEVTGMSFSADRPAVVRGGAWSSARSDGLAASRGNDDVVLNKYQPEGRDLDQRKTLGFRCACPTGKTCQSPWDWMWIWFGQ